MSSKRIHINVKTVQPSKFHKFAVSQTILVLTILWPFLVAFRTYN